jgi:hypothetical protein
MNLCKDFVVMNRYPIEKQDVYLNQITAIAKDAPIVFVTSSIYFSRI